MKGIRMNVAFLEETEIDERGLRRLAQSRDCLLMKDGSEYTIWGAGIGGIVLSDDEAWDVLQTLPQVYTMGGRNRPVV
jgi:hypothetical protein